MGTIPLATSTVKDFFCTIEKTCSNALAVGAGRLYSALSRGPGPGRVTRRGLLLIEAAPRGDTKGGLDALAEGIARANHGAGESRESTNRR
jgi:hypothetical protein